MTRGPAADRSLMAGNTVCRSRTINSMQARRINTQGRARYKKNKMARGSGTIQKGGHANSDDRILIMDSDRGRR